MTVLTTPACPRPVLCMVEHAHRDRRLADAVCDGRFTHLGTTLSLGTEPDWLGAALPADDEWRIEWHKFYYGLDLAHAFSETGDARYLRTWEGLVRSWVRQVPATHGESEVIGRRLQNWVYAWSRFASSDGFPGLGAGVADAIVESVAAQAAHVRGNLTPERNHRTLELYALLVVGLALPECDPAAALRDFALAELHRNLVADVLPDGVHREGSTHYHHVALRSYLGARENARRFGLAMPAGYDGRLTRACEFALHCHRPDGLIPALSDSDTGSYVDLLTLAASLLGRPDMLHAATAGARGVPPRRRYASFPRGGYFVQRSGWGDRGTPFRNERYLLLDCGPLGDGWHGHYDALSVEVAAGGRPLVVDPGRYTYAEEVPNLRHWFKGTAAHNTVCVDGLDQTPYRRGKPKGPVAGARLLGRRSAPGFDLLSGEVRSPCYDAVHRRDVAFVDDAYWVIVDRLRGERAHHYDLRFHLAPSDRVSLRATDRRVVVQPPGLALVVAVLGDARVTARIEDGWVSPLYGVRHRAPVLSVSVDGVASADFATLVLPDASTTPVDAARLEAVVETLGTRAGSDSGERVVVECRGDGTTDDARDRLVWGDIPTDMPCGPLVCRADAAWVRTGADGTPERVRAVGVERAWWAAGGGASVARVGRRDRRWVGWDAGLGLARGWRAAAARAEREAVRG